MAFSQRASFSEQLDWLAACREHPFDNLYARLIENLPFFLGVSLETIAVYVLFRGLWGNFIHSNSDIDLGIFKYLLALQDYIIGIMTLSSIPE